MQVVRNVGGPVYQIHWVSTYDSLAAYDRTIKKIEADEDYQELLAEVREQALFIGTSVSDSLYEAVS